MTIWHCNAAVSLDMKLARPDGSVDDWLVADYPPENIGFEAFLASVDAILMGRATYEAVLRYGAHAWPYPGKRTLVMTSRPLDGAPPEVAVRADLAAAVAELEASCGRVWIEGGGLLLRDMMRLGKLDVLELAVIPIVLGDGIPLFPPGTPELNLALEQARPWIKDALHLIYRRR